MSDALDNTPASAPAGPIDATPTAPVAARPRQRWLAVAAFVALAVALVAVWLDARNSQRALRTEVAQRLADVDVSSTDTRSALKDAQDSLRDAQAKITLLESRISESQSQQAALEALYRELAPSRDEWALTEIEQVLMLASQQLQLAGNVPSALTALQLADSKLQRLDRPQFVPLRKALTRDMDRLKAVPFVDISGISLQLDQAIAGIDALPLALEERPLARPPAAAAKDETTVQRFWRELWNDMQQFVRIERVDRQETPVLAPQQRFFLRENLKLRLLSARFELLFHDPANFRADLAAADAWLGKYFDTQSKSVQSLQTLLKALAATDMTTALPDLAQSLEAVRVLKLARDKTLR